MLHSVYPNTKNIKSDLLTSHYLGYQVKKIKQIRLSQKLRWITHIQQSSQKNQFLKRLSQRKKSLRQLSLGKSKQNQLKIDASSLSKDKDNNVNKRMMESTKAFPMCEILGNQRHCQESVSEIQLRKTNIEFDFKKSFEKNTAIKNRKMSLPVRCNPVIQPKISKKEKVLKEKEKENYQFIASLFTQRLDNNHPQIKVQKVVERQRPVSHFYKTRSEMLLSKKGRWTHSKTIENNDFEIKPWQEQEDSFEIIL